MTLRMLHISDFHEGLDDDTGRPERLWHGLLETLRSVDPVHVVAVTGDQSQSGTQEQFNRFSERVAQLMALHTVANAPLYVVPGNHDLQRSANRDEDFRLRANVGVTTEGFKLNLKHDSDFISRRFAAFTDFTRAVRSRLQWDDLTAVAHDRLSDDLTIIGLNTAMIAAADDDDGRLAVDVADLNRLATQLDSRLVVVLGHHPLTWLSTWCRSGVEQVLGAFHNPYDVYLHGHLHDASGALLARSTGASSLVLAAGAIYSREDRPHSFSVYDFDLERAQVGLTVWEWNQEGQNWAPAPSKNYPLTLPPRQKRNRVGPASPAPAAATAMAAGKAGASKPSSSSPPEWPDNSISPPAALELAALLEFLVTEFGYEWVRPGDSCLVPPPPVFWPVRLRHPHPIHAAQAFAAAGLIRCGCTVTLAIDDLGTKKYEAADFDGHIRKLMGLVSPDLTSLATTTFSTLFTQEDLPSKWTTLRAWLSRDGLQFADVLEVCRLRAGKSERDLFKRPRRLLTPVLVWTAAARLRGTAGAFLTLGGNNERRLWEHWHLSGHPRSDVGHLYTPNLILQSGEPLSMSEDEWNWLTGSDLRKDVDAAQGASEVVSDWLYLHCVRLPQRLSGMPPLADPPTKKAKLALVQRVLLDHRLS